MSTTIKPAVALAVGDRIQVGTRSGGAPVFKPVLRISLGYKVVYNGIPAGEIMRRPRQQIVVKKTRS